MSTVIVETLGRQGQLTPAFVIEGYACAAAAAIVFYDHLLTFSLEVHVFWRREVGWPTLIYLSNRYLCMAFSIALAYPTRTRADFIIQLVLGGLLSITLAFFFALRTSALWDRSRAIFAIVILAYTPGFALNYCTMLLKELPLEVATLISTLVPGSFVVFDALVLGLSFIAIRRKYGLFNVRDLGNLHTLILEHGIIYFVLLIAINIAQIVLTNVMAEPTDTGVILASSSILVSRFMLHLRQRSVVYTTDSVPGSERSHFSWKPKVEDLGTSLATESDNIVLEA